MLATAARWAAKKGKPKMAPIELPAPPEQAQSITRTIFDVVREHGPLTISDVWDHVKVRHALMLPVSIAAAASLLLLLLPVRRAHPSPRKPFALAPPVARATCST
jgi:hypothetical protein